MQLEVKPVRAHPLRLAVEVLEPRIARVDVLERELKSEAPSERARERRFSCTDHAGDTEKHFDGAAQEVKTETGSGRDAGREYCRFLFSEATSNSFFWAPASFLSDGQLVGLRVIRRRQLPQRQCRRAVDHTSIIAEA